ncbi:MAG TPA: acetoacetate--CoA ligase, partial [Gemmatimonadaceae bacterium]
MARSNMARFLADVRSGALGLPAEPAVHDYDSLYAWSVARPERFWPAVWGFCGVVAEGTVPPAARGDAVVVGLDRMAPPDPALGPRWFPGARLNFAENLLRHDDHRTALAAWDERGVRSRVSHAEMRAMVARCRAALRAEGVGVGDRVAGYLPNLVETVVAMLATASLGAVWSSCSPDFGVQGVVDRFGQIEPRVLLCADGYRYAGREIDCRGRIPPIVEQTGGPRLVLVANLYPDEPADAAMPGAMRWDDWLRAAPDEPLAFERLPFDHPLYVMYSSGTTGLPKCMVHGAGGTLLQHLKELVLHTDLTPEDRVFYFTTCGWMMWNWLASVLAVGATVVLYDGAPLAPRPKVLWDMAAAEGVTVFGTSAKYLALAEKAGLRPGRTHDLAALRTILSTGSPLAPHSYDYVYRDVKRDVRLSSISGGTDIISCFALGNPIAPVYRGELQTRGLGMAVDVFDESGKPIRGSAG